MLQLGSCWFDAFVIKKEQITPDYRLKLNLAVIAAIYLKCAAKMKRSKIHHAFY